MLTLKNILRSYLGRWKESLSLKFHILSVYPFKDFSDLNSFTLDSQNKRSEKRKHELKVLDSIQNHYLSTTIIWINKDQEGFDDQHNMIVHLHLVFQH